MSSQNPEIGLQASPGEIKIRLLARGNEAGEAKERIQVVEKAIRERLGDLIFGADEDRLETVLAKKLIEKILSLAVVENFGRAAATIAPHLGSLFKGGIYFQEALPANLGLGLDPGDPDQSSRRLAGWVREWTNAKVGMALVAQRNSGDSLTVMAALEGALTGTKRISFSTKLPYQEERVTAFALNFLRRELEAL
jgi:hypothetical protein